MLLNLVDPASAPEHIDLPNGRVRLVNAKVLHLSELAYIVEKGEKGRSTVAKMLKAQGNPHLSSTTRKPVI